MTLSWVAERFKVERAGSLASLLRKAKGNKNMRMCVHDPFTFTGRVSIDIDAFHPSQFPDNGGKNITGQTHILISINNMPTSLISFRAILHCKFGRLAALCLWLAGANSIMATSFNLGTHDLVVDKASGSATVTLAVMPEGNNWTATANAAWLHIAAGGVGSGNILFTFDTNTGPTRADTLTIGDQTVTVTQAGAGYVAVNQTADLAGLFQPTVLAMDAAQNLYIIDENQVKMWNPTNHTTTTIIGAGLTADQSMAIATNGDIYVGGSQGIQQWSASAHILSDFAPADGAAFVVALDKLGNVYFVTGTTNYEVKEWVAANNTVSNLFSVPNYNIPAAMAVDDSGNVYFAVVQTSLVWKWNASNKTIGKPLAISGLHTPYALTMDNSNNLYILDAFSLSGYASVFKLNTITQTYVTLPVPPVDNPEGFALDGAGNVYISDTGGTGSIVVWRPAYSQYGTVSDISFKLPANLAVDAAGNVFIMDVGNGVKEWQPTNNSLKSLITPGLSTGNGGLAVDHLGNIYVSAGNEVLEWDATKNFVFTLIPSAEGLIDAQGVAVDQQGNVFVADIDAAFGAGVLKWETSTKTLTTLPISQASFVSDVAVDIAGNVYFSQFEGPGALKWNAASGKISAALPVEDSGNFLLAYTSVAVDGSGNFYGGTYGGEGYELIASQVYSTNDPEYFFGGAGHVLAQYVGVDASQNVFVAGSLGYKGLSEIIHAFVNPAMRIESIAGGTDQLPPVLPATALLNASFGPSSSQPWLTILGTTNGIVSFATSPNTTGTNREAYISLLGQSIPVYQENLGTPPVLANAQLDAAGTFTFNFTNLPNAAFTIRWSHDLTVPLAQWSVAGPPTPISARVYGFSWPNPSNNLPTYFAVTSP